MNEEKTTIKVGSHEMAVSKLDKVMFPKDGITKGDLMKYYEQIAPLMLPHTKGRPISMERFVHGIAGESFYQKEEPEYFPEWIHAAMVKVRSLNETRHEVVIDDAATLVYLADQYCISMHTWLSRADKIEYPDLMVIDLDPRDSDFEFVRKLAFETRSVLQEIGLEPFVKTTGGKGLHVTVPLKRIDNFTDVHEFAKRIGEVLVHRHPDKVTLNVRDTEGKFFIDYLRNSYAQTAVAPYSVRPHDGAPIAVPIEWDELKSKKVNSKTYNMSNIWKRIDKVGDLWSDIWKHAKSIKDASGKLDVMLERAGKKG
jgi:bifunctional non-homologous end joining protein LigD